MSNEFVNISIERYEELRRIENSFKLSKITVAIELPSNDYYLSTVNYNNVSVEVKENREVLIDELQPILETINAADNLKIQKIKESCEKEVKKIKREYHIDLKRLENDYSTDFEQLKKGFENFVGKYNEYEKNWCSESGIRDRLEVLERDHHIQFDVDESKSICTRLYNKFKNLTK